MFRYVDHCVISEDDYTQYTKLLEKRRTLQTLRARHETGDFSAPALNLNILEHESKMAEIEARTGLTSDMKYAMLVSHDFELHVYIAFALPPALNVPSVYPHLLQWLTDTYANYTTAFKVDAAHVGKETYIHNVIGFDHGTK